jgi:hypothetical protein
LYFYLVASLPMLSYDAEHFWSVEQFLETCRQHLSGRHLRIVSAASLADLEPVLPTCATLEQWRAWEIGLRNQLLSLRAKRRGADEARYRVESPEVLAAQSVARNAFSQESPLQAEEVLNRGRWAHLDDLEVGHYFDVDKVVIYHLRLQILRRKALLEPAKGAERFTGSFETITRPIYGSG